MRYQITVGMPGFYETMLAGDKLERLG